MAKSRARKLADLIVGAGIDIDGNLTFDGGSVSADLTFGDNDKANFGDASDLQIYHDGSASYIKEAGTGDFIIQGSNTLRLQGSSSQELANFGTGGAVTLFHNNSAKLATTSTGVSVTGDVDIPDGNYLDLGSGGLTLRTNANNAYITESTSGKLAIQGQNIELSNTAGTETFAYFSVDGAATLYYDNSAKLATASGGITVTGETNTTTLASGNSTMTGLVQIGNSSGGTLVFKRPSANYIFADQTAGYLVFGTNGRSTSIANSNFYLGTDQSSTFVGQANFNDSISSDGPITINGSGSEDRYLQFALDGRGSAFTGENAAFIFCGQGGSGDFLAGGLYLQSRSATAGREIGFITGTTPAKRMVIDSSGNVLIGTNSTSTQSLTSGGGIVFSSAGAIAGAYESVNTVDPVLSLNNTGADGSIVTLNKDGTTFGKLANDSTSLVVTGSSTGLKFGSAAIWPTTGGGVTNSNGAKDLGASTAKFKDAYFTGTVHAQGGVEVLGTSTMIKHDYNNLGSYVQEIRADDRRLTLSTKTNDSNAGIVFELYDAEKARFDYAGRLLIGQNSNTGSANADNLVVGTGSGNNGITILSGTTNGGTIAFADADADEDGFIAYNHPSQFMQFGTAAAEQMRITSAGRVGINESSPDALLHITGQSTAGLIVENGAGNASTQPYVSMAANNYSSGYGTFRWEDQRASQASPSFIWEVHDGSGTVLAYDFRTGATGASGSKLAITQSGKVGIGTTPSYGLHVQHDDGVMIKGASGSTNGRLRFLPASGGRQYDFHNDGSSFQIYDASAGASRLYFHYNGNTGIGTTSPNAKLQVQVAASGTASNIVAAGTGAGIYLEDDETPVRNYFVSKIHNPGNYTAIGGIKFAVSPDAANYSWSGIKAFTSTSGAAGDLAFYTSGSNTSADSSTERMRLDVSNNMLLGGTTTNGTFNIGSCTNTSASGGSGSGNNLTFEFMEPSSPNFGAKKLRLGVQGGGYVKMDFPGSAGLYAISPYQANDKFHIGYAGIQLDMNGGGYDGNQHMLIRCVNDIMFHPGGSELWRMIAPTGSTPSVFVTNQTTVTNIGGTPPDLNSLELGPGYINLNRDDTVSATQIQFGKNGSVAGSIVTTSSTTYNTTSDRRAKENIVDAKDAGEIIDGIRVREFDWKNSGEHQRYGMVAQELLEVAPEVVHQPEDEEQMMGVDYSKLVPMLVKEIQSLRARVAELEGE